MADSKKKKLEQLLITIYQMDKFDNAVERMKKQLTSATYNKIKHVLKQEHQRLSKALEEF